MIICVLNRKGGSGKTTTAAILAQLAARVPKARVLAADTDAQHDLYDDLVLGGDGETVDDIDVLPCKEGEVPDVDQLKDYDFAIVDTSPKAPVEKLKKVIAYSDVVVLPFILDKHAVYGLAEGLNLIPDGKRFVILGIVKPKPSSFDKQLLAMVKDEYPEMITWPYFERVRGNVANKKKFDSGLMKSGVNAFTGVFEIIRGGKK